jgi:serine/threonine protein kinase
MAMDGARWERIQEIFHRVSDIPAAEQEGYLKVACSGDGALMAELQVMLEEDARGKSILDGGWRPPVRALEDEARARLGERDFGPYQIITTLGEGGMGIVYLARREDIGSTVAIKVLRDGSLSQERRKRFAEEQKTLARLEHPLIARIHDADTLDDGTPWFAMEYVEGKPITDYCRARACSINEQLQLFRSVCEAVQYAHRQAIIHRDLKPSNILVKADGSVKLLDFGIAKQLEDHDALIDQTLIGLRPMTLPYASPEQVRGDRLGTQTDVYSLGVVLYELLTGQLPFDFSNRTRTEAEQLILRHEPEPPSVAAQLKPGTPGASKRLRRADKSAWSELDVLSLTAMHKELQRRYRSVEALIREIDHYLKGEPLDAQPDSIGYRTGKFVRRNRRTISATATVLTIIVALVIFFMVRLNRARTTALAEYARTQRIERFMLNLFDGGDKTGGPSDSLRVVTLLDRGAQNARTLSAEPAIQADLNQTLGNIYQKLGKLDRADPLLRAALESRKSVGERNNRDVADSIIALSLLRLDQSRVEEAERLARDALDMSSRHSPPDNAGIARATFALGRVLEERGAYDEAIKVLDRAVRLQSATGEVTNDLSDSMNALVIAHVSIGHFETADSLDRRLLAMDRQLYGADHPRVADDLVNLGEIQNGLRHFTEAERYYRQGLAIDQSWYGRDHPNTALCMVAVGQALVGQGRYDEAAGVLREALTIQEHIYGKVHAQVAIGLNMLGSLELRRGHLNNAEADFRRMAEINRSVYGDKHNLVGVALENLGEVYFKKKNYAGAERFFLEALQLFTEALAPGHSYIAVAQLGLGDTLVVEKRYEEAEPHLLAAYEIWIKQSSSSAPVLDDTRKDLVTVYKALNRPDRASKFRAELAASPPRQTDHSAPR